MKWLAAVLFAALLLLQYRLWLSNDGVRDVLRLRAAVEQQQSANAKLSERNRELAAEVRDLKQGYAALEERARTDLGMIAGNETFYQVVPPAAATAPQPRPPADHAPTAMPLAPAPVPSVTAATRTAAR